MAIVIYNVTRNVLVFVKQFRPGILLQVYYSLYFCSYVVIKCICFCVGVYFSRIKIEDRKKPIDTNIYPADLGMTVELCAGIKDKDKSLIEIAQEEVIEETGYKVPIENFEKIHSYK